MSGSKKLKKKTLIRLRKTTTKTSATFASKSKPKQTDLSILPISPETTSSQPYSSRKSPIGTSTSASTKSINNATTKSPKKENVLYVSSKSTAIFLKDLYRMNPTPKTGSKTLKESSQLSTLKPVKASTPTGPPFS